MRRLVAGVVLALTLAALAPARAAAGGTDGGETLVLPAGVHEGPLVIDRPMTVVGEPGAVVQAPPGQPAVVVRDTDGVTLRRLELRGGSDGLVVRSAGAVVAEDLVITGAEMHGVFAHDAELHLVGCRVSGLRAPLAQGVEIINSDHRPRSEVRGCRIEGPVFEGIVVHATHVLYAGNEVVGSTERGIVITEMADGHAVGNVVRHARGAAFWCGDMSHCAFEDNRASHVESIGDGWRSGEGHALVIHGHSEARVERLRADHIDGAVVLPLVGGMRAGAGSDPGWRDGLTALAFFALLLVAAPMLLRRASGMPLAPVMLLTAVAVQLGHQAEHVAQVVQAKVQGLAAAHGLAGQALDNEWVHVAFNSALLVALLVAAWGYRARPSKLLLAAVAVQAYHQVEHLAKITQHVTSGATPAPGVLGHGLDLVWLHFWINTVVTLLVIAAFAGLEGKRLTGRRRATAVA
jgi:hypothetical protein